MSKEHQTGKRFQVIVLHVYRNKQGAIQELYALQDYFKSKGENYKFVGASYGSPSNSLVKTVDLMLNNDEIAHPYKTLYEIIDVFIKHKKVKSLEVADLALWNDLNKVSIGLRKIFAIALGSKGGLEDGNETKKK